MPSVGDDENAHRRQAEAGTDIEAEDVRLRKKGEFVHRCPIEQLETPVGLLDQSGAAFDPIAGVAVKDTVDLAHLRVMNMSTNDAVEATLGGVGCQRRLEMIDRFDRTLDLALQPLAQRPILISHDPADGIEISISGQRGGVGAVAQPGQELGIPYHAIELVAVHDQEPDTEGRLVRALATHLDAGDFQWRCVQRGRQPSAEHLVMVAGHVDDLGAALGMDAKWRARPGRGSRPNTNSYVTANHR